MILDAWGWCTETTQRNGKGREEGRGFRMGNTCIPVADSCLCVAKPIQYFKVISLQLNKFILKINKLKKKDNCSVWEKKNKHTSVDLAV